MRHALAIDASLMMTEMISRDIDRKRACVVIMKHFSLL